MSESRHEGRFDNAIRVHTGIAPVGESEAGGYFRLNRDATKRFRGDDLIEKLLGNETWENIGLALLGGACVLLAWQIGKR